MDEAMERIVSGIEKELIGVPSAFSSEISHEDLRSVGKVAVENYLAENGYKLDKAIADKGRVVLFGSYQGGNRNA